MPFDTRSVSYECGFAIYSSLGQVFQVVKQFFVVHLPLFAEALYFWGGGRKRREG